MLNDDFNTDNIVAHKKIVIIGATSAIAQAMARQFSEKGNELFLIGRNKNNLTAIANDVAVRSQKACLTGEFDASTNSDIKKCLTDSLSALKYIDIVVIAHGSMVDNAVYIHDYEAALREFQINATSFIGLLTLFGDYFDKQKKGSLVAFSSCAGDRGRKKNYLYGAAKAAISTYTSGLRAQLHESGVHVMTVKPGYIETPLTQAFKKNFLWGNVDDVATCVIRAIQNKKAILYVPWYWRYIMLVVKHMPDFMMRYI